MDSLSTASAAFAVAGLILLGTGLARLIRRRSAEIRWIRCTAVMHTQVERPLWGRLVMLDPVMSYTIGEKDYVAHIRTGDAGSIHQTGGSYNLLCRPENPEDAMFETDRTDVILMRSFIAAGCVLLLVGELIMLLF